jgi:hypothetical protein
MNWWLVWSGPEAGSSKDAEARAQPNPVVGIWRGSASAFGTAITEEYVFQPNLSFSQLTTYSIGGAIQRTGTYSVGPGPQSGTGLISLHALSQSQGIMLDGGVPFYFKGPNTLMMYQAAPADWIPYQRCG